MATANSASAIEASLDPDLRQAFNDLIERLQCSRKAACSELAGPGYQSESRRRVGPARMAQAAKLGHYDELPPLAPRL
jgi:hypothetical protein